MIVKLYKILGPSITKYVGSRFYSLIMFSTPSVQQDFIISVFPLAVFYLWMMVLLPTSQGNTEHLWVQNPDWPIFWGFIFFSMNEKWVEWCDLSLHLGFYLIWILLCRVFSNVPNQAPQREMQGFIKWKRNISPKA